MRIKNPCFLFFLLTMSPKQKPIPICKLRKMLTICPQCGKRGYNEMFKICLKCGYNASIVT